ncbi:MAG: hypothetical protein HOM21_18005 [Halobacteriovoraceae bacterium]|nr:hypothetical protein [Halobacteriovoraceae bacterium]
MKLLFFSMLLMASAADASNSIEECFKNNPKIPTNLDQACIYSDLKMGTIRKEFKYFQPRFKLWTDGAQKRRWIYLPANSKINNSDSNSWSYPLGTVLVKEFSIGTLRVETRILKKVKKEDGPSAWLWGTWGWNKQQDAAVSITEGANDVLGTNHDIPRLHGCFACHSGRKDLVLGFGSIQLSSTELPLNLQQLNSQKLLTHKTPNHYTLPGTATDQKALGYLHANCSHCHNADHHMGERVGMFLKIKVGVPLLEQPVYKTAVDVPTRFFRGKDFRIISGDIENSAIYHRMNSTERGIRMAPLGREVIDPYGIEVLSNWIVNLKN